MCLIIDAKKHTLNNQDYYEPKTTTLSKKVYKILYIDVACENTYYTPYMGTIVQFENEETILKAPGMMVYYEMYPKRSIIVEDGIHAFRNKETALAKLASLKSKKYAVFEAVIPPSTRYFVGIEGEIVSEKLIIKNKCV